MEVRPGRYTADIEGDFVVFLIGMRLNHPLRARDRDLLHLEPWRQFNRAVRDSGEVGIWHETFRVRAGEYEAVYGNMPVFGLAAAGTHVPAARKGNTAAARIGASTTDEPAVAPY